MKHRAIALLGALVLFCAGPAVASTPEQVTDFRSGQTVELDAMGDQDGWVFVTIDVLVNAKVESVRYGVFTGDTTRPGLMVVCDEGNYTTHLALDPFDFRVEDNRRTLRVRPVDGRLFSNGEMVERERWGYRAGVGVATPRFQKTSRKIFNMIIRGDELALQVSGRDRVDIPLPPIDDDFRQFARTCQR